ncbi:MAG TPA: sigma factor-like helix-turn-helix DNA-binding protein [Actinomycetota bacterium]|nr:sigma factor-like helix-turn-helix DNA-binding protein [Actinomycetota bacterium]
MGTPAAGFEDWYRSNHARLITALVLIAGNLADAQDAVDEACARALTRRAAVGAMASPAGWTSTSASRLLARRALPVDIPGPAREVWEVVKLLAPRQRTAIVLRYVANLTEADVAHTMGTTLADARRTVARFLDDPSLEEVP